MYTKLDDVLLTDGEIVEAGVVSGPDAEWSSRIKPMLQHKGEPWTWQITQLLERELGVESNFYLLHRDGEPFANILTVETNGVGPLGHVWTDPADRRKSASSRLMALQMAHFHERGGRALYLSTAYESVPFKIYERFGFRGIEPQSGYMEYYKDSGAAFRDAYFAPGPVVVEALDWPHWPSMQPLFLGNWPGIVRNAAASANGRLLAEDWPLPLIEQNERVEDDEPRSLVLRNTATDAIVGFAAVARHPLWYHMALVDIYCHPAFWTHAAALLDALNLTVDQPYAAYADPGCPQKVAALRMAGFQHRATLPHWLPVDSAGSALSDLLVFQWMAA